MQVFQNFPINRKNIPQSIKNKLSTIKKFKNGIFKPFGAELGGKR